MLKRAWLMFCWDHALLNRLVFFSSSSSSSLEHMRFCGRRMLVSCSCLPPLPPPPNRLPSVLVLLSPANVDLLNAATNFLDVALTRHAAPQVLALVEGGAVSALAANLGRLKCVARRNPPVARARKLIGLPLGLANSMVS